MPFRLLCTKSFRLFEKDAILEKCDGSLPSYAILSHTWLPFENGEVQEVTYQDLESCRTSLEDGTYKENGWKKLKDFCLCAARQPHAFDWAWMDTCCIDKTSLADTQEAINAMYRWYKRAALCFAYLREIEIKEDYSSGHLDHNGEDDGLRKVLSEDFIDARWFTRGWTLQELLAPMELVFVDRNWVELGTRNYWAEEIMAATNIRPIEWTERRFEPGRVACSIAQKLHWASKRETTVEEDKIYCLAGLFAVPMTLLYGEGEQSAWLRFQRKLIKRYPDDPIFVWSIFGTCYYLMVAIASLFAQHGNPDKSIDLPITEFDDYSGILAPSIKCFSFKAASFIQTYQREAVFKLNNAGLEFGGIVYQSAARRALFVLELNCRLDTPHDVCGDPCCPIEGKESYRIYLPLRLAEVGGNFWRDTQASFAISHVLETLPAATRNQNQWGVHGCIWQFSLKDNHAPERSPKYDQYESHQPWFAYKRSRIGLIEQPFGNITAPAQWTDVAFLYDPQDFHEGRHYSIVDAKPTLRRQARGECTAIENTFETGWRSCSQVFVRSDHAFIVGITASRSYSVAPKVGIWRYRQDDPGDGGDGLVVDVYGALHLAQLYDRHASFKRRRLRLDEEHIVTLKVRAVRGRSADIRKFEILVAIAKDDNQRLDAWEYEKEEENDKENDEKEEDQEQGYVGEENKHHDCETHEGEYVGEIRCSACATVHMAGEYHGHPSWIFEFDENGLAFCLADHEAEV